MAQNEPPQLLRGDVVRANETLIVCAIVALAAALRVPALFGDGLWRDEANVYVQLVAPTFAEFMRRVMATEWHPPVFFIAMYGWAKIAGTSEIALTIVPFTFSVATAAVVYYLGRTVGSRATGIAAAGLYAASPLAITYSDEYLYPVMTCLSTLLAWLVVRALKGRATAVALVSLAGVALLVIGIHYSALIYLPLLVLWVASYRVDVRRRVAIASALIAGCAPFGFWLPVFLRQRHIGLPYRSITTTAEKVTFFVRTSVDCVPLRPTLAALALLTFVLLAFVVLARARRLERDAVALGVLFVAALVVLATQNLLESRYVLAFYGLFCVFLGSLFTSVAALVRDMERTNWRTWGAPAVVVLSSCLVAGNLIDAISRSALPKSGIRALVHRPQTDAVTLYLLAPDYLASTFVFYARGSPVNVAGFVRWKQPEVFRLANYAGDWNRADAIGRTLSAIAGLQRHDRFLDVIVDDRARDSGAVPYGKTGQLVAELRSRYRLLTRTRYPGRYESVSDYRFVL